MKVRKIRPSAERLVEWTPVEEMLLRITCRQIYREVKSKL